MRISRLKVFADLATTGNFSEAARLNAISQSAVSQALQSLEKAFGVTLIDRTQKRFSLTPEGILLQRRAREICALYEKTATELLEQHNVVGGTVRVGVIPSVATSHEFPQILRRFMEANPQVVLSLSTDKGHEISAKIARGILDIGIVVADKKQRSEDYVPLYDEPLVAICAPTNTLAFQRDVSLAELKTFPFLSYSDDLAMRRLVDASFRNASLECNPAKTFNSLDVLKRAVELNKGVAIVPAESVRTEVAAGTLCARPIRAAHPVRPLAAISRKNRPLTPAMQRFIEAIKK